MAMTTRPASQQYIDIPDPAFFCPRHGYPDPYWEPPIVTPDPAQTGDEIILLCDDMAPGFINLAMSVSSGYRQIQISDEGGNVIFTKNDWGTEYYTYWFPTQGTGAYYIVKLTCVTSSASIYSMTFGSVTGYQKDYRVLQAKYYTPQLNTLLSVYSGFNAIKEVAFFGTLNYVTNASNCFYNSAIRKVVWPTSMTALVNLTSMFYGTKSLKKMVLPETMQATTFTDIFRESNIEEIVWPKYLNSLTIMQGACYNCYNLTKVTQPLELNACTNISSVFYNCYALESNIVWPETTGLTTCSNAHYNCKNVKLIKFQGTSNSLTTIGNVARGCLTLNEFYFPDSINACNVITSALYDCPLLTKVTMPTSWTSFPDSWGDIAGYSYILKEITTCNAFSTSSVLFSLWSHKLTAFQQPTLRVKRLQIGFDASKKAPLTSLEIDWANSDYSYATGPQISIFANLNATELNRIFTALPIMTKEIKVSSNPGYATCDITIATAKGWTVS